MTRIDQDNLELKHRLVSALWRTHYVIVTLFVNYVKASLDFLSCNYLSADIYTDIDISAKG